MHSVPCLQQRDISVRSNVSPCSSGGTTVYLPVAGGDLECQKRSRCVHTHASWQRFKGLPAAPHAATPSVSGCSDAPGSTSCCEHVLRVCCIVLLALSLLRPHAQHRRNARCNTGPKAASRALVLVTGPGFHAVRGRSCSPGAAISSQVRPSRGHERATRCGIPAGKQPQAAFFDFFAAHSVHALHTLSQQLNDTAMHSSCSEHLSAQRMHD